ncbi:LysE family translocator [Hoeflea sp. WL0058]|uniref:LysE family translocator n=1 Tax=Flavimaribacter sediminis TaxID=2865987 RepID=A0AAE3CZ53_9HYPH|nr:LysE family translocator [Flavimaribacter sediminis]MBW8635588.1 LysE family translocator [Flavimaribacter sediminis]
MELQVWLTFVAAAIPLLIIPGPTVLLVLSYAVHKGRNVTVALIAGVAVGHIAAMSASIAGVGTLMLSSPRALTLLKAAAVIYLVHLGIKFLRTPLEPSFTESANAAAISAAAVPAGRLSTDATAFSVRRVFLDITLVTALNPKSISFFFAIVPIFVEPAGRMTLQFTVLVATFATLAAVNTFCYTVLVRRLSRWTTMQSLLPKLKRAGGSCLLLIAVVTAMQGFL